MDDLLNNKIRLISLSEVTNQIRISSATVYRLIERGEFPKQIKLGQRSFWDQSEIDSYLHRVAARREIFTFAQEPPQLN